jgi:hypothetical protein
MDKLAEGLQKLGEDDLLQVVQMVHDNKSADSYTKNDVDSMCPQPNLETYTNICISGRVPRGPVHAPGYFDQDALGFHVGAWGYVSHGIFWSFS